MDLMQSPKTKNGHVAVLVAIDHFSKWAQVVPIKDKTAKTVANVVRNHVIPNLIKVPTSILTDNGPEFRAKEFERAIEEFGINHIYSTPYHPASNGAVERMNRTIIQMLKGVITADGIGWDKALYKAVTSYNNSKHSQTKMSPSELILNHKHEVNSPLVLDKGVTKTWIPGNPRFQPYEMGQKVLKKIMKMGNLTSNKLEPNYEGPYEIAKIQTNQKTYVINHLLKRRRSE